MPASPAARSLHPTLDGSFCSWLVMQSLQQARTRYGIPQYAMAVVRLDPGKWENNY